MKTNELNSKTWIVVFTGLWAFFVTAPMWLFIVYSLLCACGDNLHVSAWIAFFTYVPAHMFQVCIVSLIRTIEEMKDM